MAIYVTLAFASSAERIYLIVLRSALQAVVAKFFLCHRYKTCQHLGHQDFQRDASALQNVLGVHLAEDAHEHFSDLEAGQADVPSASTFSVRGDFKAGCQMLHKALLQLQETIRRMAQSKAARKARPTCRCRTKRTCSWYRGPSQGSVLSETPSRRSPDGIEYCGFGLAFNVART